MEDGAEVQLPGFHSEIDEVDLSVDICGVRFPNPMGLASAPPTGTAPIIRRAFENGWGFCVTKTYGMDEDIITNVSPRIVRGTTSGDSRFGPNQGSFLNIELISEKTEQYWIQSIRELKRDFPDQVLIASIMAPVSEEDWSHLTTNACEAGADMLELNLSCPHGMGERGMGMVTGQSPEIVEKICSWVAAATTVPFFLKVTPNVTSVIDIANAAKRGNADGVTATNTVSALMGLKADGKAWPNVGDEGRTTYGGLSGNAIRPIALRAVSGIANSHDNQYPILATGGCDSAHTAFQFLLGGAHAVQVCSAVQNVDSTVITDYISGLQTLLYLKSRGDLDHFTGQYYDTVPAHRAGKTLPPSITPELPDFGEFAIKNQYDAADAVTDEKIAETVNEYKALRPAPESTREVPTVSSIIGKALPQIGLWYELSQAEQVVAEINPDMCINCGSCYSSCNDSGYQSITFDPETHAAEVVTEDCTGCTLCLSVCPINDCITMVPRGGPYDPDRGVPLGEPFDMEAWETTCTST